MSMLAVVLSTIFVLALATPVFAVESDDSTTDSTSEVENEDESEDSTDDSVTTTNDRRNDVADQKKAEIAKRRAEAQAAVAEKREEVKTRLESKQLEKCQQREKNVQKIMNRINELGDKQLGVFEKISTRTQDFYAAKGYTLANYTDLVGAVDSAQLAAEAQVAATNSFGTDFDCAGENPLGTANAFKASLGTQKAAMKTYKTAIKDLIVGVKSAATADTTTTDVVEEGATNE